jgi:hypothetical protein
MKWMKSEANHRLKIQSVIFLLVVSPALLIGAYYYYQNGKHQTQIKMHSELQAIGHAKSKQLSGWLKERLSEATFFSSVSPYPIYIKKIAEGNAQEEQLFRTALNQIVTEGRYENIFLINNMGEILFSLDTAFNSIDPASLAFYSEGFHTGNITVIDFYFCPFTRKNPF